MLTFVGLYNYLRDFLNYVGNHAREYERVQIIMEAKTLLHDYVTWMKDEQKLHEYGDYGKNYKGVGEALTDQKKRVKLVRDLMDEIRDASDAQQDHTDASLLAAGYTDLAFIAEKRLDCLEDVYKLASLERNFNALSMSSDRISTQLVQDKRDKSGGTSVEVPEGDGANKAIQECLFVVKSNWSWMDTLHACLDKHVQNGAAYHQFYYEVEESRQLMTSRLREAAKLCKPSGSSDEKEEGTRLIIELQALTACLLHWQSRLENLQDRSRRVIPVNIRTQPLQSPATVVALCSYRTKNISIAEGEELKLLDNLSPQKWRVKNSKNQEAEVPPIICLLPGPDAEAEKQIARLRLELLDAWTELVQITGRRLIFFLSLVLWQWSDDQIKILKGMRMIQRQEIMRILEYIENTLSNEWKDYNGYSKLAKRIQEINSTMQDKEEIKLADTDEKEGEKMSLMAGLLEESVKIYQNLWHYWETYNGQIDSAKDPVFLVLVDKWEQQKIIRMPRHSEGQIDVEAFLQQKARKDKLLTSSGFKQKLSNGSTSLDDIEMQIIPEITIGAANPPLPPHSTDSTDGIIDPNNKFDNFTNGTRVEGNTMPVKALDESGKYELFLNGLLRTVKIEGVHTSDGSKLSFEEAVEKGIIDKKDGQYKDYKGKSLSLPEGITKRLVSIQLADTSNQSTQLDFIELLQPNIPGLQQGIFRTNIDGKSQVFVIKSVKDMATNAGLSFQEALLKGIIDIQMGTYYDSRAGLKKPLSSAISEHTIHVQFLDDIQTKENEWEQFTTVNFEGDSTIQVTTKDRMCMSFGVDSVLDAENNKLITVDKAIEKEILKPKKGTYTIKKSNEVMSVAEAVSRGNVVVTLNAGPEPAYGSTASHFEIVSGKPGKEGTIYASVIGNKRRLFWIRRVVDPRTKRKVTVTQAIQMELLNINDGMYCHPLTKENIKIGNAIEKDLVVVDFFTSENEYDYMVVTAEGETPIFTSVIKGRRKYFKIIWVKCPRSKRALPLEDAVKYGVFDALKGVYITPSTNETTRRQIMVPEAIDRRLLKVEYVDAKNASHLMQSDFEVLHMGHVPVFQATIKGTPKTFVIRNILNPNTNEWISLDKAVDENLISFSGGMFIDKKNGKILSIAQAIESELIFIDGIDDTTEQTENGWELIPSNDEKGNVYISTVNGKKCAFTITHIKDPETGKNLSIAEAQSKGIIDIDSGIYQPLPEKSMPLSLAIEYDFIIVEYKDLLKSENAKQNECSQIDTLNGAPVYSAKVKGITKMFTISTIQDSTTKHCYSLDDAVQRNLFDMQNGTYKTPKTSQTLLIDQAISLELIKINELNQKALDELKEAERLEDNLIKDTFAVMLDGHIKTIKILGVYNHQVGKLVTLPDAIRKGLFECQDRKYLNKVTSEKKTLEKALESGEITFEEVDPLTCKDNEPCEEFVFKTFDGKPTVFSFMKDGKTVTFYITEIIYGKKKEKLTLEEAINRGIIDPISGTYFDHVAHAHVPLSQGISQNLINVEYLSKDAKEDCDIDVIDFDGDKPVVNSAALTAAEDQCTFKISSVRNTVSNKNVSIEEALDAKILDLQKGTFKDLKYGSILPLMLAIKLDFIQIDYVSPASVETTNPPDCSMQIIPSDSTDNEEKIYSTTIDGEEKAFQVGGIINPETNEELSMDEAVKSGILDLEQGVYVNPKTGKKIRIDVAVKLRLISVNYVDVNIPTRMRTERRQHALENAPAIQFYTAVIAGEKKTFIIKGIKDVSVKQMLSMPDAIERGIIDKGKGTYIISSTGESIPILQAITKGYITVEYIVKDSVLGDVTKCKRLNIITSNNESTLSITNAEEEEKIYSITGIVNPKDKKIITMLEAIELGIIETKKGMYVDITTGESIPIVVAVSKGMIWIDLKETNKLDVEQFEPKFADLQMSSHVERRNGSETEVYTTSVQEEKKTFTITGVIDPRTNEELSLYTATKLGIINNETGSYVNPQTRKSIPIAEAINRNMIIVEFVQTQKSKEETTSMGVISIETIREKQSYILTSIMDANKEKTLTIDEAVEMKIFDESTGIYKNTNTGEQLQLADAIEKGYVIGENDSSATSDEDSEIVTETYSVTGIFDQKAGKVVSFSQAVKLGLLDGDAGTYLNNLTGEQMFLGDAISEGFIVATIVEDPDSLDIRPENKLTVGRDRFRNIGKKILNPIKAIRAMKGQ